jgi:ABC-type transport system involved in cytochrome c biogenesis permease subunit
VNYVLLAGAAVPHTLSMFMRGFSLESCPVTNLYEAAVFISWTIVFSYLILGVSSKLRFLGAYASPILFGISIFAMMPGLDRHNGPKLDFGGGLASLHAALSLLSYGAFGLACVAGLMYLSQEHDLKFHKIRAIFSLVPPIQRLETVMSGLMLAGFALLTAGLVAGALWLKQTKGFYYENDLKIYWSILVWLFYLALLLMRWRFSQTGRRFALGAVGSFIFVLLTFWGVNLLSPIHQL